MNSLSQDVASLASDVKTMLNILRSLQSPGSGSRRPFMNSIPACSTTRCNIDPDSETGMDCLAGFGDVSHHPRLEHSDLHVLAEDMENGSDFDSILNSTHLFSTTIDSNDNASLLDGCSGGQDLPLENFKSSPADGKHRSSFSGSRRSSSGDSYPDSRRSSQGNSYPDSRRSSNGQSKVYPENRRSSRGSSVNDNHRSSLSSNRDQDILLSRRKDSSTAGSDFGMGDENAWSTFCSSDCVLTIQDLPSSDKEDKLDSSSRSETMETVLDADSDLEIHPSLDLGSIDASSL
jgi:hypothetical protein